MHLGKIIRQLLLGENIKNIQTWEPLVFKLVQEAVNYISPIEANYHNIADPRHLLKVFYYQQYLIIAINLRQILKLDRNF